MAKSTKPRSSKPRIRVQPQAAVVSEAPKKTLAGGGAILRALAGILSGGWASDHRKESEHVTGWTYIAIRAICMQAMQATVSVFDDRGPTGAVMKSLRQDARRLCRQDPSVRRTAKNYWRAVKGLYNQEQRRTEPLPESERIVRLMKQPNPWQSGAMFRYEQILQLQATGTCLVWNQLNQFGVTVARYVVPTAAATPVAPTREFPRGGFRIDPSAARMCRSQDALGFVEMAGFIGCLGKTLPAEQFQAIRWPHPTFKDDGLSPLAACALFKDLSDQVATARWSQMVNGFEPSLFIEIDPEIECSEAELDAALQKMQDKYGGANNHRKILALLGANKAHLLSTTPKDMDYQNGHTQSRDAELAIFGTPPVAAGIQEAGAFAAYYASLKQFISLTCQPIFDVLAEEDTRWFTAQRPDAMRPEVEGSWIQEYPDGTTIEMEAAAVDDPTVLEQQLQTDLAAGSRTVDEVRSLRGLPLFGGEKGRRIAGSLGQVPSTPATESAPRPGLFQKPALLEGPKPVGGDGASTAGDQPANDTAGATPENLASTDNLNGAQITAAISVLEGVTAGRTAELVATELLIALGIDAERARRMVEASVNQPKPDEPADPEPQDVPETPLDVATKSAARESVRVWLAQSNQRRKSRSLHTSNGNS